jgi:pyruvate-ferredoxin/flavodoxin oxidoreductase
MFDLTGYPRRLLRRLVQTPPRGEDVHPGLAAAVDGTAAVTLTEAGMSDALVAGPLFHAAGGGREVLRDAAAGAVNRWGRPVRVAAAGGDGDAVAAAQGFALSGARAAALVSGNELFSALPALAQAAGRRIPLVVHLVPEPRPAHAVAGGESHDSVHSAAETGVPVWIAADVQEAADFTLVAHRVAEEALLSAVVAMDGAGTAFSVQDLHLPDAEVVRRFVGDPGENVHPPAPAQEILFGKHRRRLPRWHDPERPFLTGPAAGSREFALGHAGRYAYLDPHLPLLLESAFDQFARETGRRHAAVSAYQVDGADLVLIAMGSAVKTLEAVAARLRRTRKLKVGVLGIRVLHPFPAGAVAGHLRGRKAAAVLECVSPQAGVDPPLLRAVRGALGRAAENARFGKDTHPGIPALEADAVPRLASVFYGLGGLPLQSADVQELAGELLGAFRSPVFLGIAFNVEASSYPKRQVLLDALRRYYPGSERLGLRSRDPMPLPGPGTLSVAVHRVSGRGGDGLAGETARLLAEVSAGRVRSRAAVSWDHWGDPVVDRLAAAVPGTEAAPDLDEDVAAGVVVWCGDGLEPPPDLARDAVLGGIVFIERAPVRTGFWETLSPAFRRDVQEKKLTLYTSSPSPDGDHDEFVLGSLFGVLLREKRITVPSRKLVTARQGMLDGLTETERTERMARFETGLTAVRAVETGGLPSGDGHAGDAEPAAPRVVRRLRRTDDAADSLSRFWDQVGVLTQRGEGDQLAPDPYLGLGVLPPLSSAFRDLSPRRDVFPAFDPAACTGCGECWSVCPDSAMTPVVLRANTLIDSGMKMAKDRGRAADALRPAVSQIAKQVNAVLGDGPAGASARDVLPAALSRFLAKSTLPEDKKSAMGEAFGHVTEALGALPLCRTAPFFDAAETDAAGSGELFSLGVSPDACKGCALCVAVCEPGALVSLPQDAARLRDARALWETIESLPDPADETLARARNHPAVGPVASALLTREVREAFSGGDGAEPGSGEKVAMRQVLAAVHDRFRPRHRRHVAAVEALRDRLSATIREEMAKALPAGNLDTLSRGLGALERPDVNLTELSTRIETAFESGRVDVATLRRLVDAARAVNDLEWRITTGDGGLGKAPFGLLFGAGSVSAWASAFPDNPFGVPVAVHQGRGVPDLARGLLEGHVDRGIAEAGVLRRAALLLDDPKEAARSGGARPSWKDLAPEERRLVPPLLLVVNENMLGPDVGGLLRLLAGNLPVLVVVLTELDLGLGLRRGSPFPREAGGWAPEDLSLLALAHGTAFVAQTSIADPRHLDAAVGEALDHDGPALIRIYTPSPERHGLARDAAVQRARDAVRARVIPVFRSLSGGGRFRLDLDGNPSPGHRWETGDGGAFTPVHWAFAEKRFAHLFTPLTREPDRPLPVDEVLALAPGDRPGTTAILEDAAGRRFAVAEALLAAADAAAAVWATFRRLAQGSGDAAEPAPPPDAVARATHEAELAALRDQYETRIQGLEGELRVTLARQVRSRLLTLLQRRSGNGGAATATAAAPADTGEGDEASS